MTVVRRDPTCSFLAMFGLEYSTIMDCPAPRLASCPNASGAAAISAYSCVARAPVSTLIGDRKNGECEVGKLTLLWLRELDTGGRRNACRRNEVPCAAPQQIVSI